MGKLSVKLSVSYLFHSHAYYNTYLQQQKMKSEGSTYAVGTHLFLSFGVKGSHYTCFTCLKAFSKL